MDAFREGGFGMIPTTIFGLMLLAAAIKYATSPERRFVPLQLSLGILTLASGSLGFVAGLMKSVSAIPGADPDKKWIWLLGLGESLNNFAFALGFVVLAAMAASVGALRVARSAA